jgi:hypothetical protein
MEGVRLCCGRVVSSRQVLESDVMSEHVVVTKTHSTRRGFSSLIGCTTSSTYTNRAAFERSDSRSSKDLIATAPTG